MLQRFRGLAGRGRRFASSLSSVRHGTVPVFGEVLRDRVVLEVRGEDAPGYVMHLVASDVRDVTVAASHSTPNNGGVGAPATASAFLNAQGRIMSDTMVSRTEDGAYRLDVSRSSLKALRPHLKAFSLHKDVKISLNKAQPLVLYTPTLAPLDPSSTGLKPSEVIVDPRTPTLGLRVYGHGILDGVEELKAWNALRYACGVCEGEEDMEGGLPLESNLDLHSGVSFSKGCYLGQENTTRSHFKGIVRKRFVAAVVCKDVEAAQELTGTPFDPSPARNLIVGVRNLEETPGLSFPSKGTKVTIPSLKRSAGTFSGSVGPIGGAVVRLDHAFPDSGEVNLRDNETMLPSLFYQEILDTSTCHISPGSPMLPVPSISHPDPETGAVIALAGIPRADMASLSCKWVDEAVNVEKEFGLTVEDALRSLAQ